MPLARIAPRLADDAPSIPAQRRRVWVGPDVQSHDLIVLTHRELVLASLNGPPRPEIRAAAELGDDLDELFGQLAVTVHLDRVRRARLDLVRNTAAIDYDGPGGRGRADVVFSTPEVADAFFTKLWRRLGTGFALAPYRRDGWTLAAAPLGLCAAILLLTGVLAVLVATFHAHADDRPAGAVSVPAAGSLGAPDAAGVSPLERAVGWMDWRVVCGLGGAAAAATQVWLYRRVTTPPAALELRRA